MKFGLTSIVLNKQGGISRYVCELAQRYAKIHDVSVITSRHDISLDGVNIFDVPIIQKPISMQVATAAYMFTKKMYELKKNGLIDLMHGQGAECIGADIVTAHSCQKAAYQQFIKEREFMYRLLKPYEPRNRVVLAIEKMNFGCGKAKKCIAVSNNVKEDIHRLYKYPKENIEVIYNGVNLDEFNPAKKEEAKKSVRQLYSIDDDKLLAVFSGWEFKRKGLTQIIDILPKLPEVEVLIVGSDNPKHYLELAKKRGVDKELHFTGHVKDISRMYAASDFMLFPTAYEPFGLVITEAMACGIPVVTTSSAGAGEIITDGVDGLLFDNSYDTDEILEKTRYLIDNDLCSKMGLAARKTAEKYSWEYTAEETMKVYESVL